MIWISVLVEVITAGVVFGIGVWLGMTIRDRD